ncbi:MAG: hypothetical protein K0U66_00915 [Gammaproteobacteria bacterium]|nr:hypothetical protein [Gammaproteobacteria bacterium]
MLRSCLAMMASGETSFDEWVGQMRDEPFYALISGFEPHDVPGVGTFYDFQDRLLQREPQARSHRRRPYQRRDVRDQAATHKDKNDLRPHAGIVNRLTERIGGRPFAPPSVADLLAGQSDMAALPSWEQVLQRLFYGCFVAHSVELGLLDLDHLHVAGDGAKVPTWSNPHGKKLCDCDNRGKRPAERCRCHRAYNDPQALWGWDNYRHCWVYGHTCYELTAYALQHRCQLPLVITMADGNRHDSALGLATLYRGREIFGLPIQTATLDAAHDVIGYYRLATVRWHMALVIPLNQRNQGHLHYAGPLRLDGGIPICPAGLAMRHAGFCRDRLRIKWRCPLAASTKTPAVTTCPHFGHDCSGSPYGRVIYTYPKDNYRLHTHIPRDSERWQLHANARSCAERSVKRKKYDFHLLQTRTAGRDRWFFRFALAAICQHIDAWLHHTPRRPV